jgi:plasmid stability protein
MEAEVRSILTEAVEETANAGGIFDVLIDRFSALGGVDLELAPRTLTVRSADLSQ